MTQCKNNPAVLTALCQEGAAPCMSPTRKRSANLSAFVILGQARAKRRAQAGIHAGASRPSIRDAEHVPILRLLRAATPFQAWILGSRSAETVLGLAEGKTRGLRLPVDGEAERTVCQCKTAWPDEVPPLPRVEIHPFYA
jgi:hypothetical protein